MPNLTAIATQAERALLATFRETIQSVKDQAVIQEIVRLLEVGNVDGVIDLLQLDQATFEPIEEQIRTAYRTGGITGAEQIGTIPTSTGTLVMRFNMRAPAAEAWLASLSSRLITEVFDEQKQMVRERLTDALSRGVNPRQSALDLVGRVDRQTQKRTGGFIGLTKYQAGWVRNSQMDLELIGASQEEIEAAFARANRKLPEDYDPASSYLSRTLRDKRFDGAVKKAAKNSSRLNQKQIGAAVSRYQDSALRYRGRMIARTESINALRAGQFEAMQQAIIKGEVDSQDVTKSWNATGDARTRLEHLQMEQMYGEGNGIPINQPFISPTLDRAMFPGDSSLGADGSFLIACRCRAEYVIDFIGRALRVEGFS